VWEVKSHNNLQEKLDDYACGAPDDIVGHKTFAESGGFRHEPLTRAEADVLLAAVDKAKKERAERMPTEKDAVIALWEAWQRLHELGWRDGIYCPKDGSHFQAITLGSTGIFDCVCEGEWPDCTWTIFYERDAYPSSQAPALIKVTAMGAGTEGVEGGNAKV
jgi:hypothetical protein